MPIIVYEGDFIENEHVNGELNIRHKPAIPRVSNKMLGGYCIVQTKQGLKPFWMDIKEMDRLKGFSEKNNKVWDNNLKTYVTGKANDLYFSGPDGQPDEGFFKTKITKAALKNYPKKKTLQDNQFDDEVLNISDPEIIDNSTGTTIIEPIEEMPEIVETDIEADAPLAF